MRSSRADVVVKIRRGSDGMYRPLSTETIAEAWKLYDLFKARGLDAAFLKEDLSSLALMVA